VIHTRKRDLKAETERFFEQKKLKKIFDKFPNLITFCQQEIRLINFIKLPVFHTHFSSEYGKPRVLLFSDVCA